MLPVPDCFDINGGDDAKQQAHMSTLVLVPLLARCPLIQGHDPEARPCHMPPVLAALGLPDVSLFSTQSCTPGIRILSYARLFLLEGICQTAIMASADAGWTLPGMGCSGWSSGRSCRSLLIGAWCRLLPR